MARHDIALWQRHWRRGLIFAAATSLAAAPFVSINNATHLPRVDAITATVMGPRSDSHRTSQAMSGSLPSVAQTAPANAPIPAFPGAQGGGAAAIGGRGGTVYPVISLADDGPGTLRDCAETRSGPRTCIFAVSGIIELQSSLYITNPYLTVAGQTAPGGGILITRAAGAVIGSLVLISTHEVIWQYTRLRHRYIDACADADGSECGALLAVESRAYNVISDHNSLSWNQDEGYGAWRARSFPMRNITFSNSLIAEGLASHSTGLIAGAGNSTLSSAVTDLDLHHNLFMNNSHRNPLLKIGSARVVNNIFYNQRFYVGQFGGAGKYDVIGNYFKRGPMTSVALYPVQAFASNGGQPPDGEPSLYLSGNLGWHNNSDQWTMSAQVQSENGSQIGAIPSGWRRTLSLDAMAGSDGIVALPFPIVAEPAGRLAAQNAELLQHVGASRRVNCLGRWIANRDSVDERLIRQYRDNTGITTLPENETQAGGMPAIAAGEPCVDNDRDGLPDEWELARFQNLNQTAQADPDGDGYTHLEAYLHGRRPPIKVLGTESALSISASSAARFTNDKAGRALRTPRLVVENRPIKPSDQN
jgi:pectate lyase